MCHGAQIAKGNVSWIWVDRGHFSLSVAESRDCVTQDGERNYLYGGHKLALFNRGEAEFVGAVGEFPFPLDPHETPTITDYISPPFVASFESGTWWVFEYIPYPEMRQAFPKAASAPQGVGINQESAFEKQRLSIGIITLLAVALLFLIHSAGRAGASSAPLLSAEIDLSSKDAAPQTLGQFTLNRRWNALTLEIASPVDNAWTDLELALVDDKTGRSFWTGGGVEFNSGVDSDGVWTEGSQFASKVVRSIPAGTYTLLAKGATGTWSSGKAPTTASVRLVDAGTPVSNLLVEILVALLPAAFFVWRGRGFEVRRWSSSDFSPYESKS